MCNPALLLAVGTTAVSVQQQSANRSAQLKVQKIADKRERERLAQQQTAERINESVIAEQRALELQQASKKVREARATARVSASESGVAGQSVDLLLDDFTKQGTALKLGLERQGRVSGLATNLRIKDQAKQSQQNLIRINQPVAGVNYAGAIMSGVGMYSSASQAWSDFKGTQTAPSGSVTPPTGD